MTWHACPRTKGTVRSPVLPAPTDGANASAAQSLVRWPSGGEPGSAAGCGGGGKRQPRTGPALPRDMPVGEAGTDSPFPPHGMEGEEDDPGTDPGEEPALAGQCHLPGARPVALSSWPCLPSGGGCQPVEACVGCPGKALRRGISLAPASRSVCASKMAVTFGLHPHAVLCGCAAPALLQLQAARPSRLFLPEGSRLNIEYRPAFGQKFPHGRGWRQAWGDTRGLRVWQGRGRRALHCTSGPWPQ